MTVGALTLVGPLLAQDRTCVNGQTCIISGLLGQDLSNNDVFVIADTCGVSLRDTGAYPLVSGTPKQGWIFGASQSGASASFGSMPLTASGGDYRLCWCAGIQPCTKIPEEFRTDVGRLELVGPLFVHGQSRTCISGLSCEVDGILGNHLVDGDRVIVLETCAQGSLVPRFLQDGMLIRSSASGARITWGNLPVTAAGGQYRLCWCASGFQCSLASNFAVDVGSLKLLGPWPLQQARTCVAGQLCFVEGFTAYDHGAPSPPVGMPVDMLLDSGHLWMLDTCALHHAWPSATSGSLQPQLATGTSWTVSFGSAEFLGAGGDYRLCWCPGSLSCDVSSDFRVDVGQFYLIGPTRWAGMEREFRGHCGRTGIYGMGPGDFKLLAEVMLPTFDACKALC